MARKPNLIQKWPITCTLDRGADKITIIDPSALSVARNADWARISHAFC